MLACEHLNKSADPPQITPPPLPTAEFWRQILITICHLHPSCGKPAAVAAAAYWPLLNDQASIRLETTSGKTQPHTAREDPTTRGSRAIYSDLRPLNTRLPTHGRQPLENTGIRL